MSRAYPSSVKNPNPSLVARNIRRRRKMCDLTQEKLAELAGVSSVKMIESGRRNGRLGTLQKIADALHCRVSDLFEDDTLRISDALAEFLSSPMAHDVTDDEVNYLQGIRVPGRTLTPVSYYKALEMIRASTPEENVKVA